MTEINGLKFKQGLDKTIPYLKQGGKKYRKMLCCPGVHFGAGIERKGTLFPFLCMRLRLVQSVEAKPSLKEASSCKTYMPIGKYKV
jgi:hypothetical protein